MLWHLQVAQSPFLLLLLQAKASTKAQLTGPQSSAPSTRAALHCCPPELSFLTLPSHQSPPLHYHVPLLWAGLTLLVIASPQVYLSAGFTKTLPVPAFPAFQCQPTPAQRLDIFPPHPDSQQLLTETMSPFVSCFCPPSKAGSSHSPLLWSTPQELAHSHKGDKGLMDSRTL